MSEPSYTPRPRRWWIAFLLNALLPPVGFAYAGAWIAVGMTVVILAGGAVAATEWTLASPPGIYRFGTQGLLVGSAVAAVLFGIAGAIAAWRAPAKGGRPSKLALLYMAPWVLLVAGNMAFGAYGPHPTYNIESEAMSPTLQPGDILMVGGARAECGKAQVKPGDVVVFRKPGTAAPFVHRIVAGPGQTVAMDAGVLTIDGKAVARRPLGSVETPDVAVRTTEFEETLPNGARYHVYDLGPTGGLDQTAAKTVPAGSWYLLGDNRDNAADSRVFGPVSARDVCAVAAKVVYAKDERRVGRRP